MIEIRSWAKFKRLYSLAFKVPEKIVEYLSLYDFFIYASEGFSLTGLSNRLEWEEDYIRTLLKSHFNFEGFKEDLDFDARELYERYRFNRYVFISRCKDYDKIHTEEDFKKVYEINQKLDQVEKELFLYYAGS